MTQTESKPNSDKEQNQAPQTDQYAPPYLQQFEEDTIDLYELWINIWKKKWWVIALTTLAALGSVVYTQVQFSPHYKTKALLQAPSAEDIKSLNTIFENVIFEVDLINEKEAQEAFRKSSNKLPIKTKTVPRRPL